MECEKKPTQSMRKKPVMPAIFCAPSFSILVIAMVVVKSASGISINKLDDPSEVGSSSGSKKCGIILIHGIYTPFIPAQVKFLTMSMGISPDCVVKVPRTPFNTCFQDYMIPAQSVLSPIPGESKRGLENSLHSI